MWGGFCGARAAPAIPPDCICNNKSAPRHEYSRLAGVRVSGGDLGAAEAPTDAAAETRAGRELRLAQPATA